MRSMNTRKRINDIERTVRGFFGISVLDFASARSLIATTNVEPGCSLYTCLAFTKRSTKGERFVLGLCASLARVHFGLKYHTNLVYAISAPTCVGRNLELDSTTLKY